MHKISLPYSKGCFICGEENPIGMKRRFYMKDGGVVTEFKSSIEHQGFPGVLHGGIVCALLDETMGWAPTSQTQLFCMTAELNVRFLMSVPIHKRILVIGTVDSINKRLYRASGKVVDDDGTVYATATRKIRPLNQGTNPGSRPVTGV